MATRDSKRTNKRVAPDDALDHLSSAMSLIATATHALAFSRDAIVVESSADQSEMITCLVRGVVDLKRAYNEMDRALVDLTP